MTFCIIYFLIELMNYRFTDLPFWNYILIQAVLDFVIVSVYFDFMKRTSWFVPITRLDEYKYIEFRAIIHYFQQYIFAFFVSNVIMLMIHGISIFLKKYTAISLKKETQENMILIYTQLFVILAISYFVLGGYYVRRRRL